MRTRILVCLVTAFAPIMLWAQATGSHFDGTWTTTMACDASEHMPAYQWTFQSRIANGVLHAQHGEEHGPGYLVIDGTINRYERQ